jgi:hypothetical protein
MGKPYSGKPDSPFIGLQWIRRFRAYRRQLLPWDYFSFARDPLVIRASGFHVISGGDARIY